MKKDYAEIVESRFKEIFAFSDKVDLFFVNVTVGGKKPMISKTFMKRIKMCESIIQEESMAEPPSAYQNKSPTKGGGKSLPPVPVALPTQPTL